MSARAFAGVVDTRLEHAKALQSARRHGDAVEAARPS
jgi:hypothetical protein